MKHAILLCVFLLSLSIFAAAAPAATLLADFDFTGFQGGRLTDRTGNAVLTAGKGIKPAPGPFGSAALLFDGSNDAVAKLDFSKIADRLDGYNLTLDLWVRYDAKSPDTVGFGLTGQVFTWPTVSPFSQVWQWFPMEQKRWHRITVCRSVDQGFVRYYYDGVMTAESGVNKEQGIYPASLKFTAVGPFHGALGRVRLWDGIPDAKEFTNVTVTAAEQTSLRERLGVIREPSAALAEQVRGLEKELDAIAEAKTVPLGMLTELGHRIDAVVPQAEADRKLKNTTLRNAPFAFLAVQPVSGIVRTPDVFPTDGRPTDKLYAAAAKGEFEPLSFVIRPYRKIERFEIEAGDFHGDNGATIPSSALDAKVVKCWYQASWNNYKNNIYQNLLPDLLLNDDTLVRVDEKKRKNYLRFDYAGGARYNDVNYYIKYDTPEAAPHFNFLLEPVYDAPKLLPVTLDPFRSKQFWLTVHVPSDAKPGLYRSKVAVKCDGESSGSFEIVLRVYPFALPPAKTSYDLSRDYLSFVIGTANLPKYASLVGDTDEAERILRLDLQNQADHNIRLPGAANFMCDSRENTELALRDVQLRKDMGFPLKPFLCMGRGQDWQLFLRSKDLPIKEVWTADILAKSGERYLRQVRSDADAVAAVLGHRDLYFYGIDEATSEMQFYFMSFYRDLLFREGLSIMTAGWGSNYNYLPSHEVLHAEAARIDRSIAAQWHAIGGRLVSYAAPFAGPDNPLLMRHSHGMKMYRANYDGFFMLSYAEHNIHLWNERLSGQFRNFLLAYPTSKGPVNTIAIEGFREGQDDIRYVTLLRMLAADALASDKPGAAAAARSALLHAESADISSDSLDAFRQRTAEHILELMRLLDRREVIP